MSSFATTFLLHDAVLAELDRQQLAVPVLDCVKLVMERAAQAEYGRDPKYCVTVREEANVLQIIVNVQPRPGDAWPVAPAVI